MEIPLLADIVIILGLSVVVIYLFQRLRLPTILGFLMTGILAGPSGLRLVKASHEVEIMAEIGVILLLFIIGIEFSLKRLAAIRRTVLVGGLLQVGLTIGLIMGSAFLLGFSWPSSIFLGFLFSLSSTAIVLKTLQERNEVNSAHGKIALGILIFQDIIVVPMMLVTPLLAGDSADLASDLLLLAVKTAGVIMLVIVGARYVVPWLMYEIAKTNRRELFILSTVVICFAVAWATSSIGLSLALGAFLAGLIISETEYSYQAAGAIIPFHEIFTSFFFVSIGMLLDLSFLWDHLGVILLIGLAAMIIKALVAMAAGLALQYTLRTSLITGLVLFQVGEFAFILARTGIEAGVLTDDIYQYFLAVSILSMAFTPFVIQWAPAIAGRLARTPLTERLAILNRRFDPETEEAEDYLESLKDHVIIIGYGMTGRHLAQAARYAQIPYVILESNAAIVREERDRGEPIFFGDATSDFMLEHLKVWSARVAIVAISDPEASKMVVSNIRSICHTVHVIVRTRYLREANDFKRLGASEVVPEELETSIEIFTRLMNKYLVPQDEIGAFVQGIRADNFEVMRPATMALPARALEQPLNIPDINVTCLRVQHGKNEVVGRTLAESNIRAKFGVNLLAVVRGEEFISDIHSDIRILQDDLLYVAGKPEAVAEFNEVIRY